MNAPIFLGGGSRVARLAISGWPGPRPVVVARRDGPGVAWTWDMSDGMPPPIDAAIVFNFAGVTPLSAAPLSANTDLALTGLRAAATWGARHVFVMSSSAVYGDTGPDPAQETRALAPLNAYGVAKAEMERSVLDAAAAMDGAPAVTILRLANVAGAGQPFDAAQDAGAGAVTLHRFADGRGPSRSFVGPDTLARALADLGRAAADGRKLPAILNVASRGPTAMADILTALGHPFVWADAPSGAIQHVHLDVRHLNALCPPQGTDGGDARTLVSQVRAAQSGTA